MISIDKSNWFILSLLVLSCLENQLVRTAAWTRAHFSLFCSLWTLTNTVVCWILWLILVSNSWILLRVDTSFGFRFILWELVPESWPELVLYLWESKASSTIFCDRSSLVSHLRLSTDAPALDALSTVCETIYSGLQPTALCMSSSQWPMLSHVLVMYHFLQLGRACDLSTVGVAQRSNSVTLSWIFISPIVVLEISIHRRLVNW